MPGAPALGPAGETGRLVYPKPTSSIAEVEPSLLWSPAVLAGETFGERGVEGGGRYNGSCRGGTWDRGPLNQSLLQGCQQSRAQKEHLRVVMSASVVCWMHTMESPRGWVCSVDIRVTSCAAGVGVSDNPGALYNTMHAYLAGSAVDGVKVDCQVRGGGQPNTPM